MVAGYHLIWTVYGYWLPNDPRGSTSSEVRIASIKALGPLHYGRKKQQPPRNDPRIPREGPRRSQALRSANG